MKKMLTLILILCLAALPAMAETAVDAVASASVADYYADGILTGDDLMNAINSYTGFYAVASVNSDAHISACSPFVSPLLQVLL